MRTRTTLLAATGAAVLLLGLAAAAIVTAPVLLGQTGQTRMTTPTVRTLTMSGPAIGVSIRDVDAADVRRDQLPAEAGAFVTDVRTDGPAARAGIKEGDVIVQFDGEAVRSARHLSRLIDETPEGREVKATVVRAGERVDVAVTPEADYPFRSLSVDSRVITIPDLSDLSTRIRESIPRIEVGSDAFAPLILSDVRIRGRLGVSVQNLTGQLGEYFGAEDGALVTSVDDDSPAGDAGLRAGDVVTKIGDQTVRDASDFRRRLSASSGDVAVTIIRDRREQTITLRVESARPRRLIVK